MIAAKRLNDLPLAIEDTNGQATLAQCTGATICIRNAIREIKQAIFEIDGGGRLGRA